MPDDAALPRALPVPDGRIGRALALGSLTTGVLGHAVANGLRQVAGGSRPRLADMVLTPDVAQRLARDLGRMRGAAMKLGQLLSMDTGAVLPPEMTRVLAALRADAPPMPPKQLRAVLDAAWGPGWYGRFARFDVRPFAAASIGQVHRATLPDGRDLAIKVQYPGVRASIDSDLDNLAALMRVPGVLPRGVDLSPLLAEARVQLHAEADYQAEAAQLAAFHAHLAGDPGFRLPALIPDLTTDQVLAMEFVAGDRIEDAVRLPQGLRDTVAARLTDLVLRELFVFGRMQTDPNPANFRVDPATGQVVLLDFGAAMQIPSDMVAGFRRLMDAALGDDPAETRAAMAAVGYFDRATDIRHQALIQTMFETAMAPVRSDAPFDFAGSGLIERLRDMGAALGTERDLTHVPPPATLFVHRKIGGVFLIAAQLRARVALRPIVDRYRSR
ncbi:MAG: AarF/ABC1/UbiB kinase family protein [Rhodobacteraceae bacterium]|jgi:predicted unusual protein kinase regulating ubiquinone biosynthesis (AarF/ABC1/UbiB family)|nr:AarF/ABC1/UbiB kinase family protein [Paracoccaceae bacterium]